LKNSLKDLSKLLDEILIEEKKMHDSLMKYKKNNPNDSTLSDFDKMLV